MPSSAANSQRLFCSPVHAHVKSESFEAVAQACEAHLLGRDFAKLLRTLSRPLPSPPGATPYPFGHTQCLQHCPGGYGHRTHAWEQSASELRQAWTDLLALRSLWNLVRPQLLSGAWPVSPAAFLAPPGPTLKEACSAIESFIPKEAAMKRHLGAIFTDLEPGWEAQGGVAFAIWMGGPKQGFMSDTKRPVGAAAARLFESTEAAAHKLRALHLGLSHERAAIVRMRVEIVGIESSEPGAHGHAPRMAIAKREARELEDSLNQASLDDIARALGADVPASPIPHQRDTLSGRQEGFACWIDGPGGHGGFINPFGDKGSLLSATLKATAEAAFRRGSGGPATIVRVTCQPVAIERIVGEPDVTRLKASIACEEEVVRCEALARQSAETLRERARELRLEYTKARKRSGRL